MIFEAMKASVLAEMKSKAVEKFRNNLPVFETLGVGFVRQAYYLAYITFSGVVPYNITHEHTKTPIN